MNIIIPISIILCTIMIYLVIYSINQKVETPEVCKIAMRENSCNHCPKKETCGQLNK